MDSKKKKIIFVVFAIIIIAICVIVFVKFSKNKGDDVVTEITEITTENTTVITTTEATTFETTIKETKAPVKGKNIVESYAEVLKTYQKTMVNTSEDDYYNIYYIDDMDDDGVKELIIAEGNFEAIRRYIIYSYDGSQANNIGSISGGHSNLFRKKDGGIYVSTSIVGYGGNSYLMSYKKEKNDIVITGEKFFEESKGQSIYDYTCKEAVEYMGTNFSELMSCSINDLTLVKAI